MEYLIKRTDGEWLTLHKDKMETVFKPEEGIVVDGNGDFRTKMANGDVIEVNFEDAGFHVILSPFSGTEADAERLVGEMLNRLQNVSSETGEVLRLN